MQYPEFCKLFKNMCNIYGKTNIQDSENIKHYYEFLDEYSENEIKNAFKSHIKTSRFFPTIAEIIAIISNNRMQKQMQLLNEMKKQDYFKSENEYEKAIKFVQEGIVPQFLKDDCNAFYTAQKGE